jgi:outer membrane protein assembly factor BamB
MPGRQRGERWAKGGASVAAATRVSETPAQAAVTAIKTRIAGLHTRDAEALEQIQREQQVRAKVAVEMIQAKAELDALVAAPMPSGEDPTAWLADELLILILLQVGWRRGCEAVCRRWRGLCQDVALKRQLREGRWEEYAAGRPASRTFHGGRGIIFSLAVGPNEKVYSGSSDRMVRVWSTRDGQLLQTLKGHTDCVHSLAVAQDGTLYSGSWDGSVHVWCGKTGRHLRTLIGHHDGVLALAIGANGDVFSGSGDQMIRVWSGLDGTHIRTLVGHTSNVNALAASPDKVYSGSLDSTIRVWSATNGAHLQTLTGHTDLVAALAVGPDGNLFSGSRDGTVREWCGNDGTHLRSLQCDIDGVKSLAVGRDGRLFVRGYDGIVLLWRSMGRARQSFGPSDTSGVPNPCCLSAAGTLYTEGFVEDDQADSEDEFESFLCMY